MAKRILRVEWAEWQFWIAWVLTSVVGYVVVYAVAYVVAEVVYGYVFWAVAYAGLGAVVGTGQWLILRKRVERSGWWVLASVVGYAVGPAVGPVVFRAVTGAAPDAESEYVFRVVTGAGLGAVVGTGQWLILRKRVERSGWWVLASVVGYAVAYVVAEVVYGYVFWAVAVHGAITEGMYSAITGGMLVLMLRRPIKGDSEVENGDDDRHRQAESRTRGTDPRVGTVRGDHSAPRGPARPGLARTRPLADATFAQQKRIAALIRRARAGSSALGS
jgi:hypothetical protein